ncbi:MAG: nucleotidyltransferase domain-containing protein, partial [Deltaproteobacteria bacterium]|nr:nucleotidyltransferase domain-containing protein [Deltaproteobacteria bacterium]
MGRELENIDLTVAQRASISALLQRYLPGTEVWAYGSRVKFTSKPSSDLDMVAFASKKQSMNVSDLKEAFEESDLPFRVDLFVW